MGGQTDRVLSFSFLCTACYFYHIPIHEKSVPFFSAHYDMRLTSFPILFCRMLAVSDDYILRGYTP